MLSFPLWGTWIETEFLDATFLKPGTSFPLWGTWIGTRTQHSLRCQQPSFPLWGTWIETQYFCTVNSRAIRRSLCGERGLKPAFYIFLQVNPGRSLCGERGLKLLLQDPELRSLLKSFPLWERGLKRFLTSQ